MAELRRFKDILGIKTESGKLLGFHSRNLEIATIDQYTWSIMKPIDQYAWSIMQPLQVAANSNANPASGLLPTEDLQTALSELETWNSEEDPQVIEAQSFPNQIRTFSINVAQVCNLKCTYCGAGGDGTYGSKVAKVDFTPVYDQIRHFLSKLKAGDTFHIQFMGGEPLMYPSAIRDLAQYAQLCVAGQNIPLRFSIITNGTMITAKVAELFAKLKMHVIVSLDSVPEINDKVRPLKGRGGSSSALTLKGLEELSKVRSQLGSLRVNSVFGDHNMDLKTTYHFLKQFDFDMFNFSYASSDNDAEATPLYIEAMREIAEIAYAEGGFDQLTKISPLYDFLNIIDNQERQTSFCGAGKSLLLADTKGDLHVCNWFMNYQEEKVGHGTQLDQEKMDHYAKPLIELNDCGSCWARFVCGGGCMFVHRSKTGDKHKKDPYFCQRTRALVALCIEYYEKAFSERSHNEAH